jgi:7-cyano-7-deazaguanine synthase
MPASRAVVLVSGGLDSATALAIARADGFDCHALTVDYGQRHQSELEAAVRVAKTLGAIEHRTMHLDFGGIGGSALTDSSIAVPESPQIGIPITYVPARNTVMLSLALGWAEVLEAAHIYIGVNAVDYSGYPDCRPAFIAAFERVATLATRAGVEGTIAFRVITPLIDLTKAQIIQKATQLGVDLGITVSCYQADASGAACGHCDSCRIRRDGFQRAGVADPTRYYR